MFRLLVLAGLACLYVCQDYDDIPDFDWDEVTVLDEYVHRDDGFWSYTLLETIQYNESTLYVLNMTSQKWMDESFCDRSVWWHWMGIAVPNDLRSSEHAVLAVAGGSNRNPDEPPTDADMGDNILTAQVASASGVITAYIQMVPNQPVVFTNDPNQDSRSEDDVIAWTWRSYLDDPDIAPEVLLRCPMTKGAKRGLDTISEFLNSVDPELNVDKFFVSGGSKRGWTTWSLAAVDQRVVGIIPLVFSLLNFDESLMKHYQALNGWSFAFRPYWAENLTQELFNPRTQDIWDVEDPFRYRSRLLIEKYLISATGDEFFLNQDSHYWWTGMPEPLHHYMVANAEHTLAPHYVKIYDCIMAFVIGIIEGIPFPQTSWEKEETEDGGWIRFHSDVPPRPDEDNDELYQVRAMRSIQKNVNVDSAPVYQPEKLPPLFDRRDWRLAAGYPDTGIQPVWWFEEEVEADEAGLTFYHETNKVDDEWVGHLIEATYDGPEGWRLFLTSQVNIIPDTFPVEACTTPEECWSELV